MVTGILITTFVGNLHIYPFCKFATETVILVQSIGDVVYTSMWYKMPIAHQKYMQMIIAASHIPRKVSGFGLFDCSLDTYVKVNIRATI